MCSLATLSQTRLAVRVIEACVTRKAHQRARNGPEQWRTYEEEEGRQEGVEEDDDVDRAPEVEQARYKSQDDAERRRCQDKK